jgi:hypothetical protein
VVLTLAAGLSATLWQTSRARVSEATAARNLYVAQLALGLADINAERWPEARAALDRCPEHLRGWEWRHLYAHASVAVARLPGTASIGQSRRAIVTWNGRGRVGRWSLEQDRFDSKLSLEQGLAFLALDSEAGRAAVVLASPRNTSPVPELLLMDFAQGKRVRLKSPAEAIRNLWCDAQAGVLIQSAQDGVLSRVDEFGTTPLVSELREGRVSGLREGQAALAVLGSGTLAGVLVDGSLCVLPAGRPPGELVRRAPDPPAESHLGVRVIEGSERFMALDDRGRLRIFGADGNPLGDAIPHAGGLAEVVVCGASSEIIVAQQSGPPPGEVASESGGSGSGGRWFAAFGPDGSRIGRAGTPRSLTSPIARRGSDRIITVTSESRVEEHSMTSGVRSMDLELPDYRVQRLMPIGASDLVVLGSRPRTAGREDEPVRTDVLTQVEGGRLGAEVAVPRFDSVDRLGVSADDQRLIVTVSSSLPPIDPEASGLSTIVYRLPLLPVRSTIGYRARSEHDRESARLVVEARSWGRRFEATEEGEVAVRDLASGELLVRFQLGVGVSELQVHESQGALDLTLGDGTVQRWSDRPMRDEQP